MLNRYPQEALQNSGIGGDTNPVVTTVVDSVGYHHVTTMVEAVDTTPHPLHFLPANSNVNLNRHA